LRGARDKNGNVLRCALDTELSVRSLYKLNEGAILSASSGLLYKALVNRS